MSALLVPHNPAWPQQFEAEAQKILQALGGWVWNGGVVYFLEHVGSTSIPGLVAKPCIDIALAVYPFPLEDNFIQALQDLGYQSKGEYGIAGRQYFRRGPHEYHLHIYEAGSDLFSDQVLFRNYLRFSVEARGIYEKIKLELAHKTTDAYTEGKAELIQTLLKEARAWHIQTTGFSDVEFIKRELRSVQIPWCVASGWALDLFMNQVTRIHHDFDVCIWRSDQQAFLQYLKARAWDLYVPVEGKYRPWQDNEFLQLPIVQVHAKRADMPFELLDILLMEHDDVNWMYRREPKIMLPKSVVMKDSRLAPILEPAIILLFKSRTNGKYPRAKDQSDFEAVLPYLSQEQKTWLDNVFAVWLPEHPWRKLLN